MAYLGGTRDGVFTKGAIPESEYRIMTKNGRVFHRLSQMGEVSDTKGFQLNSSSLGIGGVLIRRIGITFPPGR